MSVSRRPLSKRETQIMEILYSRGPCTAAEVQGALPSAPGYSTVRKLLEILETKGHVTHKAQGRRYVYRPRVSPEQAARSAMRRVMRTFFKGSPEEAVEAILSASEADVTDETLERLEAMIRRAKRERE